MDKLIIIINHLSASSFSHLDVNRYLVNRFGSKIDWANPYALCCEGDLLAIIDFYLRHYDERCLRQKATHENPSLIPF